MNFLAHLYLADDTPESIVGNMLGDFAKGDIEAQYPPEICRGIVRHRKIDVFTDHHPVFRRSKQRLGEQYRHLKGIMVDIFYDHFLARNWSAYASLPLEEFSAHVYRVLNSYKFMLPSRLHRVLFFMETQNWLVSYRSIKGIERVMQGMSRRLSRKNLLAESVAELQTHYADLESDFGEFFPEVIEYVEALKREGW